MLTTFDAPKFNASCTRRDRSNTPLQSLTVANSAPMFEMAQRLASRALAESPATDDHGRLTYAFRLCFARPPLEQELTRLQRYLTVVREQAKREPAAWTAVATVLMNLDEFITRE